MQCAGRIISEISETLLALFCNKFVVVLVSMRYLSKFLTFSDAPVYNKTNRFNSYTFLLKCILFLWTTLRGRFSVDSGASTSITNSIVRASRLYRFAEQRIHLAPSTINWSKVALLSLSRLIVPQNCLTTTQSAVHLEVT